MERSTLSLARWKRSGLESFWRRFDEWHREWLHLFNAGTNSRQALGFPAHQHHQAFGSSPFVTFILPAPMPPKRVAVPAKDILRVRRAAIWFDQTTVTDWKRCNCAWKLLHFCQTFFGETNRGPAARWRRDSRRRNGWRRGRWRRRWTCKARKEGSAKGRSIVR